MQVYAIIPAAGRGLRMGKAKPKQFLDLLGKPILVYTLEAVSRATFLDGLVLVVPSDFVTETRRLVAGLLPGTLPISVVVGGKERQDSVWNALCAIPDTCRWVLIHDGARPLVSSSLLEATWRAAGATGAAIAAVSATDTVKRVHARQVQQTLPRDEIWLVQTPQVFRVDLLRQAYVEAQNHGWTATDDASLVERLNVPVTVVLGERSNIKVTSPEDLDWMRWFVAKRRGGASDAHQAAGDPSCA
jgi:2-C-methyl-D-erythritol 4-phosphate cytidylyltransferase